MDEYGHPRRSATAVGCNTHAGVFSTEEFVGVGYSAFERRCLTEPDLSQVDPCLWDSTGRQPVHILVAPTLSGALYSPVRWMSVKDGLLPIGGSTIIPVAA